MTWDANGSPVCDETGATPKCECACGERPPPCDYTGVAPFTPCRTTPPEPTYTANIITWPTPVSVLL